MLDVCTGIALFIIETHKNTITKTSKKIRSGMTILSWASFASRVQVQGGPSVFVLKFCRSTSRTACSIFDMFRAVILLLLSALPLILSVSTL